MQLRQVFWAEIGWYFTIAPNCITGPSKGIPNRLSYGVFPSDKRSPTIFHPGLNATTPQMSLLSLCALLSLQFHLFPICAVLTNNDSRGKVFTIFSKFKGIVCVNDFWFHGRLQKLLEALFCFLRSFGFTWVWLYPLTCQVLCHYSVSMIVSRFFSFTKNFVIRCY